LNENGKLTGFSDLSLDFFSFWFFKKRTFVFFLNCNRLIFGESKKPNLTDFVPSHDNRAVFELALTSISTLVVRRVLYLASNSVFSGKI
jgi:hypothetical protein